jgi:predicted dehydrogenase
MLTFGVVGCGYWGPNLIRNLSSLPDCEVKYVCDTRVERLAHMRQLYPQVTTTSCYGDLVGDPDVDAVIVAVPVRFHYEMAKKALDAGKHTFIEKPMARSSVECLRLIEAAEQRRLTLMVGHTFVYSTPVRKIKEIVDSGQLGDIQYVSSRRLNLGLFQKDINVAWDLAPHDISILLHILGEAPISVNCQGKSHVMKGIEDVTDLSLQFANGTYASIQSSWLHPSKVRETIVVGSKMMLVYDDLEPNEKIKIYDKRVEVPPYYDTFAEFQYSYYYGDVHCPFLKLTEPLKTECEHFRDCIVTGTGPESGGVEGLRVVQILESASASLAHGGGLIKISDPAATPTPVASLA